MTVEALKYSRCNEELDFYFNPCVKIWRWRYAEQRSSRAQGCWGGSGGLSVCPGGREMPECLPNHKDEVLLGVTLILFRL